MVEKSDACKAHCHSKDEDDGKGQEHRYKQNGDYADAYGKHAVNLPGVADHIADKALRNMHVLFTKAERDRKAYCGHHKPKQVPSWISRSVPQKVDSQGENNKEASPQNEVLCAVAKDRTTAVVKSF